MTRISWQQFHAPFDMADEDVIIPPRKHKSTGKEEWRLQVRCVNLLRQHMRVNKTLRFIAPQPESPRDKKRAALAKMMGLERGIPDLILLRLTNAGLRLCLVEFKRPGGKLTPEQRDWFQWLRYAAVECHRCDSYDGFAKILENFMADEPQCAAASCLTSRP